MTERRRYEAHARTPGGPGKMRTALRLVPRNLATAAGQSVGSVRDLPPRLLRNIDLPPALGMLVAAVIFALICIIYLTQVTAVSNANYDLLRLEREHTLLLREQADLQLETARAQSLPNIETAARTRLQMVPLGDRYTYIAVDEGPLQALPAEASQTVP